MGDLALTAKNIDVDELSHNATTIKYKHVRGKSDVTVPYRPDDQTIAFAVSVVLP